MSTALRLPGAAVRAAGTFSPRAGAAVAMPFFAHVAKPRPVHADDAPTMSLARRRTLRIPGVDRRGVDVVVYEWGRGPRTVVLSHGWLGRASQLSALVRELTAEGYRVVAFDGPAHGDTGGRHTYLVDWLDVFAELQQRHGRFDAIVGHSFGGLAALVGVAGGVDAARVVTISALADADQILRGFQRMIGCSDAVMAQLRRRFAARYFPGDADPFAWLSAVRRPLPDGIPLLIAHDEGDRFVPFGESARIAAANPGARVMATTGFGHNRILAADAVLDAVVDFVTADAADLAPAPVRVLPAAEAVRAKDAAVVG
ncbi:alpha/beta fold hydrolase [Microbacterium kyungheense]|uniref:Alpha-beta hydrolase superfamily lysophospholipase n=1 Tax=Microbacterium kyungheense TaxID=1263636 RepID=A0A543ES18_9MICO|nr:alpha/beta fold hydrolase [Microbacterium kyungheense]TQM24381.1 alpha-beta hydrolase superfamily lysophospholipase [Microbacterium kyungheense]